MRNNLPKANSTLSSPYLLWLITAFFYFYENFLQIFPSTIKAELSLAFLNNAFEFGSLAFCFAWSYGLMQIPAGLILDRFSERIIIPLAWFLVALGSLLFSISHILFWAQCARILMGIGSAFALLASLKSISLIASPKQFSFLSGITLTIGYLGTMFSLSCSNAILKMIAWRDFFSITALIGIFCSIVLFFFFNKNPDLIPLDSKNSKNSKKTYPHLLPHAFGPILKRILTNKKIWLLSLFAGCMFIPTAVLGLLWGIPFLMEAHALTHKEASLCVTFIYFGWLVGSPFWGKTSDHASNTKIETLMFVANIGLLLCCIFFMMLPTSHISCIKTTLFLIGFFSSGYMLVYKKVNIDQANKMIFGTTLGFIHTINCLCSVGSQSIVSLCLDSMPDKTPLTTYQLSFIWIPVCLILSLFFLYSLNSTPSNTLNTNI
jgi:sugar phosphate permease